MLLAANAAGCMPHAPNPFFMKPPNFYRRITNILQAALHTKVFCAGFLCLQFGFVIFW